MSETKKTLKPLLENPALKTAAFLSFKVKREGWNLYRLEDETLLKAKFVLKSVLMNGNLEEFKKQLKSGEKPRIGLSFRSNPPILSAEPPPKLRGAPDTRSYNPQELRDSIEKEDMDFETVKESWNIYEFDNGITLKARLSPVSISRTSKFDGGGMPIYVIDSNADLKVELPDHLRGLFGKRKERT